MLIHDVGWLKVGNLGRVVGSERQAGDRWRWDDQSQARFKDRLSTHRDPPSTASGLHTIATPCQGRREMRNGKLDAYVCRVVRMDVPITHNIINIDYSVYQDGNGVSTDTGLYLYYSL